MKIARVAVPLLLAAFACDHPTPPEPGDYTPGGPFNTDSPRQLTFSPGPDLPPAWLPDGSGIGYDTVRAGIELARMDLKDAPGTVTTLAGTDSASSVALGAGDTIYYTAAGDSRVFRRTFAGGDTAVWDFGTAGIARDLQVRGATLYAVVGGAVGYSHDPTLGPLQFDGGGVIHAVNLLLGTDTPMADAARYYRRIALSPDGRHIVAEGLPIVLAGAQPDLWGIDLP